MSAPQRAPWGGTWFLLLFALPFTGIGVFMTSLVVRQLGMARKMQAWVETPALVQDARLASHRGHKGGTTYSIEATYSYTYDGHTFTGTRISIHGGSDNIGSFQMDTYHDLARLRDRHMPVTCYVNPAQPGDSVLYRNVRTEIVLFELVFAVLFGGFGLAALIGGLCSRRTLQRETSLAAAHPQEPWRWREKWAGGAIRSGNRAKAWFVTGFAFFWNVFVYGIFGVQGGPLLRPPLLWLVLLFALAGLYLAVYAVRAHVLARRYGTAVFRMASVPGTLGGRLAGAVQLPGDVRPADGIIVQVLCVDRVQSGKHSQENILWSDERHVASESLPADATGTVVPVLFALPYDLPPSGTADGGRHVTWRLQLKGRQPGVDVDVQFDVPVFRTAESRPDFQLDEKPLDRYLVQESADRIAAGERVNVQQGGSTVVLDFPAARRPGQAAVATAFTIGLAIADFFMWRHLPVIFPVVLGVVVLLCVYTTLNAWLGTARIEADRDGVRWRKGYLGSGAERSLGRDDLADVVSGMTSQNNQQVQYKLFLVEKGGRRTAIGREFFEKSPADAAARELKRVLGLA